MIRYYTFGTKVLEVEPELRWPTDTEIRARYYADAKLPSRG